MFYGNQISIKRKMEREGRENMLIAQKKPSGHAGKLWNTLL